MEVLETQEMNDNTFLEEQEKDVIREQEDQKESSKEDDIQVIINDVEEIKGDEEKEEDEKVERTFFYEKDLSENLVETLIKTDLTDEHVRLAEMDQI